jgi:hypothetical protein
MVSDIAFPSIDRVSGLEWHVRQYCVPLPADFRAATFVMPWDPWQDEQAGASGREMIRWCGALAISWLSLWHVRQDFSTWRTN